MNDLKGLLLLFLCFVGGFVVVGELILSVIYFGMYIKDKKKEIKK